MSDSIVSSVSSTGRLTIPHKLRARLGLRGGSKVVLQEVTDGVILLSTTHLSQPQIAERLLQSLVTGIGSDAERLGILQEGNLAPLIEAIREQTFAERYGHAETTKGFCGCQHPDSRHHLSPLSLRNPAPGSPACDRAGCVILCPGRRP